MDKSRENGIGVWMFYDGEREWIAAASKEEAIRYYLEMLDVTDNYMERVGITEVEDLDVREVTAIDYSVPERREVRVSLRTLIRDSGPFPCCIASSVY